MNKENVHQTAKKLTKDILRPTRLFSSERCTENQDKKLIIPTRDRSALGDINFNSAQINEIKKSISTQTIEEIIEQTTNNRRSVTFDRLSEAGTSRQRSKSIAIDTKFITLRKDNSPQLEEELFDEVFIDGQKYFNDGECYFKLGDISPVKPNVFTSRSTVLIPGLREKLARKSSLAHKFNKSRKVADNLKDNLYVEEYLEEYISCILKNDIIFVLKSSTFKMDNEIAECRKTILDWLLKVQAYNLIPTETFLKAVRLFDLVLNATEVSKNMYQLVAMASIWMMNKFETSTMCMSMKRLINLSGSAYSGPQLLKMERKLLYFLDFRCNIPEPTTFVEYFICKTKMENLAIRHACYYILESFSLSPYYALIPSSLLGASVFYMSLELFEEDTEVWDAVRTATVYFTPDAMVTTKGFLLRQLMRTTEQCITYREYNVQKKCFVSKFVMDKIKIRHHDYKT